MVTHRSLSAVALIAAAIVASAQSVTPVPGPGVSFDQGKTFEPITSIEGGYLLTDTISTVVNGVVLRRLKPGATSFGTATIRICPNDSWNFQEYIAGQLDGSPSYDPNARMIFGSPADAAGLSTVQEFQGPILSEVGFPKLDGSSKNTGFLTVRQIPVPGSRTIARNIAVAARTGGGYSQSHFHLNFASESSTAPVPVDIDSDGQCDAFVVSRRLKGTRLIESFSDWEVTVPGDAAKRMMLFLPDGKPCRATISFYDLAGNPAGDLTLEVVLRGQLQTAMNNPLYSDMDFIVKSVQWEPHKSPGVSGP